MEPPHPRRLTWGEKLPMGPGSRWRLFQQGIQGSWVPKVWPRRRSSDIDVSLAIQNSCFVARGALLKPGAQGPRVVMISTDPH